MLHRRLRQVISTGIAAVMLLSSLAVVTSPTLMAAPAAQVLQAEEVSGVLPGGEFAKIWLELTPTSSGDDVTITTEWDRSFPEANGVGFFVLDENGLASVLNQSASLAEANLSAGSRPAPTSPDNQLGAVIHATGGNYTIVLFNDSVADANFTLSVTNGTVQDDSNQVRDVNAAPTAASGEEAADAPETGEEAAETEAVETPVPVATTATTDTMTAEVTATPTATAAAATTPTVPSDVTTTTATTTGGVVRAQELRGELVTQNAQHYFDLEPSERDAEISLLLSIEPQDNSELTRRLNFWVLESAAFASYADASSDVVLSEIALAAGSTAPGLLPHQRQANFTASGMGPYVVIVYNNALVPGSYTLQVEGATLVDDFNQSLTATQSVTGTASITTGVVADTAADGTDDAAPAASGGREGTPGDTYVVVAGDTLSLIARDIYGEIGLWNEICAFNNLADCDTIEIGDELQLPTREQIGAGIAPAATTTPVTGAAAAAAAAAATPEVDVSETVTGTEAVTTTATTTATGTTTDTDTTTDTSSSEATGTGVNLVAALEAEGGFSTLLQTLEAAGLISTLETAGPFTILAPTDAAFETTVSPEAMEQLLANPTGQLTQILLFHVLSGNVMSEDIDNGMQATTQQGKAVGFEVVAGGTVRVNGANITASDIVASNGVVHAIDAVILPPPDEPLDEE